MELNRDLAQVLDFSNGEMMSDYWILRHFKFWTKPFSFKEELPSCGPYPAGFLFHETNP